MAVKRIGFVDYRLDNYHAEVYLKALRGPLASRGYEVAGATSLERTISRAWAEERSLPYFSSIAELNDAVDCYVVLAPSNPELHLELCQETLPFGKMTFVDKTFAPDELTARAIFALADACEAPIQTTSALRSTAVQAFIRELPSPVQSLTIFSSGTSFEEYGIHPVELAVSCLGHDVVSLMRFGPEQHPQWLLQFSGERTAVIDFNPEIEIPFSAIVSTQQGHDRIEVDGATLFLDAAASILDFFDAGRPLIDRRESLAVRRILDVAQSDRVYGALAPLESEIARPSAIPSPHWDRQRRADRRAVESTGRQQP
jgi:predicted dehydrogenase